MFSNFKGFINSPANYLPKLTNWINEKIAFWQTDLGSNLLQNNTSNVNVKRSLAVSAYEQKPNCGQNEKKRIFYRNNSNSYNKPHTELNKCQFL